MFGGATYTVLLHCRSHDLLHEVAECESGAVRLQHLVGGYSQLHRVGLLEEVLRGSGQTAPGLAEQLLRSVFEVRGSGVSGVCLTKIPRS